MSMRIALAGNPNCGKTTLFNALTGSNQFVGNWPGVTVEKKEGKLKRHDGVTITDLPGIYSLSPYTLEEVVARNYLISERPDAILNIIDGTNLERNLYLTTQLTELGIPVVIAVNMMDVVEKNGDKIDTGELSRALGCKVVEISALKGNGIMEAAEAAINAAKNGKTVPMHTFTGTVEHALAHIEEAAVHGLPEEQQRFYAIKLFERDDKVLEQLKLSESVLSHIETDIKAAEKEMDDDAESIITNERYLYIGSIIKGCLKKKSAGKMTDSDKIDRIVTNRFLGLPIFAAIMFLVYYISMVTVGASATDWANDGLFGDGWHLLGIGSSAYGEAAEEYGGAALIVDGYDAYVEENGAAPTGDFPYEVADEETLEVTVETASLTNYEAALAVTEVKSLDGYKPDPAPRNVELKSGKLNVVEYRNQPYPVLKVVKLDTETRQPLEGVKVKVFNRLHREVGTYTTNRLGQILLSGVDGGETLYVQEVEALPGYELDETVHEVTLAWGQTSIVEILNREKATLRLKKVDVETKAPIYGVVFNLYDAKNNLLGEYVTDQNGVIEFPRELPAGKYKLKEVQAAGYVVDPTIRTVEVKSGETTEITIENRPMRGYIQIVKKAADDNPITKDKAGALLEGAVFEVYNEKLEVVATITTNYKQPTRGQEHCPQHLTHCLADWFSKHRHN